MTRSASFARFAETEGVRRELKQKSVRGAMAIASSGVIDIGLRLASLTVLARLLIPEDFGLVAMVTALTMIVDGFRDLGLGVATVQRQDISDDQVSNLFWVNASAGVALTLLFCALSPAVAAFYRDERLSSVTVSLAMVFVWSGLAVQHEALMHRQLRQGELAAVRVAASFLSLVVAITMAMAGLGYWALVWRELVRVGLVTAGVWWLCPWIPGRPRRRVGTADLLRFGRDISVTHLLVASIINVDRLLIGRYYGPGPVGLYRQSQQLLVVPIEQMNAPIMSVAHPALSALQGDHDRYRRYYERIVFLVTLATAPVGLFAAIYASEITLLVLGPNWADAAVFVRIFAVGAAIRPAVGTSAVVLVSCGLSSRYMWIALFHSVVLGVLLVGGVRSGAEGVALAHVGTTILMMFPRLYFSFRHTPVSLVLFLRGTRVAVLASVAMGVCLLAVRSVFPVDDGVSSLVLGVGLGGIAYVAGVAAQSEGRRRMVTLAHDLTSSLRSRAVKGDETQ